MSMKDASCRADVRRRLTNDLTFAKRGTDHADPALLERATLGFSFLWHLKTLEVGTWGDES